MKRLAAIALLLLAPAMLAQQTRIASDFEIAQTEKQLAASRDFLTQLSGRLNLGDLRAARNELTQARAEYTKARALAAEERLDARSDAQMTRYATATAYEALAEAKLSHDARAFELAEEAIRYTADTAKTWNLYASTMNVLRRPAKAVSAARVAVAIATKDGDALDLAVYQYALASALIDAGEKREAETLLSTLTQSLRSARFASLQREVARGESFEIYSTARGDAAAYVSLLNRSQLRLASLVEERGDRAAAMREYQRVLDARSDDATALAALARLATSNDERARRYAEAFDANPFSLALIRQYQRDVREGRVAITSDEGPGAPMRQAAAQLARGERRAARTTLDALAQKFPDNETLKTLQREASAAVAVALPSAQPTADELRTLAENFEQLTPEQRVALDQATYTSLATMHGEGSTFDGGLIDGVPFRFTEPTVFNGGFAANAKLRLTYRILGPAGDGLLLEPLRLENAP
ncbi:MAG TPA: hypothetical protein VFN10_16115 [Thermoanaerobaculia bacterium]|nr:hypothetical protein [Thermoanaerobaculia bacterium]